MSTITRRGALTGLALLLAIAPLVMAPYTNARLSLLFTYAIAILGLNLLTGYAGQISVAQSAFFGMGAYTASILIDRDLLPALLTIPLGAVVAYLSGILLGVPALRIRGLYLAIVTMAVALAFPPVVRKWESLTGGFLGLSTETFELPSSGLAPDQVVYYLTSVCLVIALFVAYRIREGQTGRSMAAVRESELLASTFGLRVAFIKVQVFGLSAAFAGAAGALFTLNFGFIAPDTFGLHLALTFVIAMVIGGARSLVGAVLGAAFIVIVPEYASEVDENFSGVIYAVALIACIYLLPGGLASLPRTLRRLTNRRRHQKGTATADGPHDRGLGHLNDVALEQKA